MLNKIYEVSSLTFFLPLDLTLYFELIWKKATYKAKLHCYQQEPSHLTGQLENLPPPITSHKPNEVLPGLLSH